MLQRARYAIVACIALAVLAGGCGSVTVRPGITGHLIAGTAPNGNPIHAYLLMADAGGDILVGKITHTPIEVTQTPTDEEFWQFEARERFYIKGIPSGRLARDYFPVGPQPLCEVIRQRVSRKGTPTEVCTGPHYFKRTGPPAGLSFEDAR